MGKPIEVPVQSVAPYDIERGCRHEIAGTSVSSRLNEVKISYKEMARRINELPAERQEDNVTVWVTGVGEVYASTEIGTVPDQMSRASPSL